MRRVCVYVEGPSDVLALRALLRPLLESKQHQEIGIEFFAAPAGNKKESMLLRVPIRAVNILANDPDAVVVALPDLYPPNKVFPHSSVRELTAGLFARFDAALQDKQIAGDRRVVDRFHPFCLKHDMEALLLASPQALATHLSVKAIPVTWRVPVEDQDHDTPPKRIVEQIFAKHGRKYKDTADAPVILGKCRYEDVAQACPQCFGPFVDFLNRL